MQTISVALDADNPSHIGAFQAIVESLRQKVRTDPVTIEVAPTRYSHTAVFTFVSYSAEEYTLETIDIVRAFVALALAEWVVRVVEPACVALCVRNEPRAIGEWEKLKPYVLRVLNESAYGEASIGKNTLRKSRLYRTFFAYLLENSEVHLHGFVRFRLKEYRQELAEAVAEAIDDYLEDQQYQEFIELLRFFVSTQESRRETIHIVPLEGNRFALYDESGLPLQLEGLEAYVGMRDAPDRTDDLLLSALISLAPHKIVFHQAEGRQALAQTLHSIFEDGFSYCSACAHCLINGRTLDFQQPTPL
ncbi:hypothetical protein G3578_04690 [Brevibacillus sp. SYP-B805]|uniref:sporulation protein YtxC n=1 Tax=Brevibacillus sp. SYP-B805 TaxID=1578199 RepID=UPI0013EE0A21|nr:hypothetical protein [Brevibacillus sp. SYP-B805]